MEAKRIVVTVEGETYKFRKIQGRDYIGAMGKLGVLPSVARGAKAEDVSAALQRSYREHANAIYDRLLSECSVTPKLVMEAPEFDRPGIVGIPDLPDDVYNKLRSALIEGSGLDGGAAAALDPSSGTAEV